MSIIVLEWGARGGFLIDALLPHATRIALSTGDSAYDLLRRVNGSPLASKVVLFHINLSEPGRLPKNREVVVERLRGGDVDVWNARVCEISKPAIQRWNRSLGLPDTEASRRGPKGQRLIVKTRLNAFGAPEQRLSAAERVALGYSPPRPTPIDGGEYPVLTRGDIPAEWWQRKDLFFERFIENGRGEFFRLYFAGPQCVLCHCFSNDLVKRTGNTSDRINYFLTRQAATQRFCDLILPSSASTALRNGVRFADAFGLHFGAIDVVCDHHGTSYVVDVNPTPWWGNDEQPGLLEHLRRGFDVYPRQGAARRIPNSSR